MQTKLHSILEVSANLFTGFLISLLLQLFVFPLFGWIVDFSTNLQLGLFFATIAFIRGYIFRRVFNYFQPLQKFHHSGIEVILNIFTGWLIAFSLQLYLFPIYGIAATLIENIQISIIFTVTAVIRALYFRRLFNTITVNLHLKK